jgi:hypothetical protein
MAIYYANGFAVDQDGVLLTLLEGTIHHYKDGLPRDISGKLVVTATPPSATDPFVGGIAVSSAGVCITAAPPSGTTSWSSAFSTGEFQ